MEELSMTVINPILLVVSHVRTSGSSATSYMVTSSFAAHNTNWTWVSYSPYRGHNMVVDLLVIVIGSIMKKLMYPSPKESFSTSAVASNMANTKGLGSKGRPPESRGL